MANNQKDIPSSPSSEPIAIFGAARLGEFLAALVVVTKHFESSAPDRGRKAVCEVLWASIRYISDVIPARPDLTEPLRELMYGLKDLDNGTVVPLLKPAEIAHRPPNSISQEIFRADAAVLMDLNRQAGSERKTAAGDVARRLNQLGCTDGGKAVTGKRVAVWRDRMRKPASESDHAAKRYSFALEVLKGIFPKDPKSAFEYHMACIEDMYGPKIPKKVAS